MEDIKRIDIKEFRSEGFLQEVNRKFFHPLGLALEVIIEKDGTAKLGGIWDYREDPEGNFFSEDVLKQESIDKVEALRLSKLQTRIDKQGEYDVKVDKDGVQII
jgi:hypothetical protein